MKTIERHIEYLLSRNDCVIIPGLGAILARNESARIVIANHTITPPRRVFTFNSALSHSDGAIACSISRAENISYDAAASKVRAKTGAMNSVLKSTGSLQLGRIGTLTFDTEQKTIQFHPADFDIYNLPTVHLDEQAREEKHEAAAVASHSSAWARMTRVAASIAVLIGICFVASTPISVNDAALASLSPEIKHTPVSEFLPAEAEPVPSIAITTSNPRRGVIDINSMVMPESIVSAGNRFLVVIGSFASANDAEKFINANKMSSARYVEQSGRFRVYSTSFANEADAYRHIAATDYSATGGAWVCKI